MPNHSPLSTINYQLSTINSQLSTLHSPLSTLNSQLFVGALPDNWTVDRLKAKHPSKPFNPDVANVFFRAGTIEAWGRGIERMCAECAAHGVPEPVLLCEPGGMWVEFANRTVKSDETIPKTRKTTGAKPAKIGQGRAHEAHEAHEAHVEGQVQIGAVELVMLRICAREPASSKELLAATGYSARTGHFKRSLEKLIHENLIVMTIPDKPRSRQQKYRLSEKGKSLLAATAFGGTDL
jgi:ATP-dependent DNA helicase RecG